MIKLPKTTEYNRRIPKEKFYENINISSSLKRNFINQIKNIYWKSKISKDTINLDEGPNVKEIEIIEIYLKEEKIDEEIIKQIDIAIPYHLIFYIIFEDKVKICIGYKEIGSKVNIDRYFYTEWEKIEEYNLVIQGLNLEIVYNNFIKQIAGEKLDIKEENETIKKSINRLKEKEIFQQQIKILKEKIRKEKQFNKQVELNMKLKELKKKMEEI